VIFVDASTFLRYLTQAVTPQDEVNAFRARRLFSAMEHGRVEITTSEAILAEVVFILSHPRHYGVPRADVAVRLQALLRDRGCRVPAKDVCLRALGLWVADPNMSFPDALGAAYSELQGHELATFDVALARTPGVIRYKFERAEDETPGAG
jgi:predicted nucleic acid-binding protein